jgi:uncharacterized protein (DUF488 family)
VDTRINNTSQLSGFAKGDDLEFFARKIGSIAYEHNVDFAPTKELFSKYRQKMMTWNEYEIEYLNLLDIRKIKDSVSIEKFHHNCLLCSEHTPEFCHRRLLAEYFQRVYSDVNIIHLQ